MVFWQPPVEDSGPWHRLTALTIAAGKPGSSGSDSIPVRCYPVHPLHDHRLLTVSLPHSSIASLPCSPRDAGLHLQAWAEQIPSSAVEAGATLVEDARPSYAMHWRDLREFYRVGVTTLCSACEDGSLHGSPWQYSCTSSVPMPALRT